MLAPMELVASRITNRSILRVEMTPSNFLKLLHCTVKDLIGCATWKGTFLNLPPPHLSPPFHIPLLPPPPPGAIWWGHGALIPAALRLVMLSGAAPASGLALYLVLYRSMHFIYHTINPLKTSTFKIC